MLPTQGVGLLLPTWAISILTPSRSMSNGDTVTSVELVAQQKFSSEGTSLGNPVQRRDPGP